MTRTLRLVCAALASCAGLACGGASTGPRHGPPSQAAPSSEAAPPAQGTASTVPIFAGEVVGSGGLRGDVLERLADIPIESELATRCRRLLTRFEPEVAAAEQPRCEAALTDGRSLRDCEAAGRREVFERCFEGCLRSVTAVVDPVDNCEGPCAQIECGENLHEAR